jgi:hypothetical protein
MFFHTAQWYDTIYLAMQDYGAEAPKLTTEESIYALTTEGIEVTSDEAGLTGRGLFIGPQAGA